MSAETMENAELGMDETIEVIKNRLGRIRTGKATPALLDGVKVDYYGTPTPLNQLAAIAVPEPRLLTVKPFERAIIQEAQKAIQAADMGLNRSSDGMMIRLQVPELTEDRRKDLAKQAKDIGEDGKVGVRKVRQEANDTLKAEQKDGVITEDDLRRDRDAVQKLTDKFCEEIDRIVTAKSAEIMGM